MLKLNKKRNNITPYYLPLIWKEWKVSLLLIKSNKQKLWKADWCVVYKWHIFFFKLLPSCMLQIDLLFAITINILPSWSLDTLTHILTLLLFAYEYLTYWIGSNCIRPEILTCTMNWIWKSSNYFVLLSEPLGQVCSNFTDKNLFCDHDPKLKNGSSQLHAVVSESQHMFQNGTFLSENTGHTFYLFYIHRLLVLNDSCIW